MLHDDDVAIFHAAVEENDIAEVERLLEQADDRRALVNATRGHRGRPPVAAAPGIEMANLLLRHGADCANVSAWWESGFGARMVQRDVRQLLLRLGTDVSPHAAAALGLVESLQQMIATDASVVNRLGGDGATPLHFARNRQTAELLLQHGADPDARDEDHDSTPAQWLIGDAPEAARLLIDHGAEPDIFVATVLGDRNLLERVIAADPKCTGYRIGKAPFHSIGYQDRGGTILQWTVGFNRYPHQVAAEAGDAELLEFLNERSDTVTRFLVSCLLKRREEAFAFVRDNPNLVTDLPDEDNELVARYCWETNIDPDAVRLMLDVGFPVDHPEPSHGYMPLHNAAWCGHRDLVELLISRGAPLNARDPNYNGTPLGFALHCCLEDGRHPEGDYPSVVDALLNAGARWDPAILPTGHPGLDAVFERHLND